MSHHSSEQLSDSLRQILGLGATGNYPDGKLNEHDEGEIKIALAADPVKGLIYVDFGKPVRSLALTAKEAEKIEEDFTRLRMRLRGIDM